MPTVSRLSTTPVKGSALHHPDEVRLERSGQGVLLSLRRRAAARVPAGA